MAGQNAGEQSVVRRPDGIHTAASLEQRWRPAGADSFAIDLLDAARAQQRVEMKADRVGVHTQFVCHACDAAGLGGSAQESQNAVAAFGHQSSCLGNAATISVSASMGPSFAAPPGD